MLVDLTLRLERTRARPNYTTNIHPFTIPLPPSTHHLQRINKKRTFVPHIQQLLIRISSPYRLLPLFVQHLTPTLVFPIASPPQDVSHDNRRDTHPQTHTEANWVFGSLGRNVNVRAGNAAHVADGDQETHADGALG